MEQKKHEKLQRKEKNKHKKLQREVDGCEDYTNC